MVEQWEQLKKIHYCNATFANTTTQAISGIINELTALRLTALQSHMALDLLLAKEGGVCHLVGSTCCIYIPPNDDAQRNISLELHHITHQLCKDEQGNNTWPGFY